MSSGSRQQRVMHYCGVCGDRLAGWSSGDVRLPNGDVRRRHYVEVSLRDPEVPERRRRELGLKGKKPVGTRVGSNILGESFDVEVYECSGIYERWVAHREERQ